MRVTAKLAYSQIKINRWRTVWTLIGIIISTALITSVCSFAASGNALAVDFLGDGYGDYRGTLSALVVAPAIFLSGVIVAMSVIVISNAFRVSAGERTAQFGTLKSVGATKKQIMETVMYESMFLSAVGIPAGIFVGLVIAFVGVEVANHFLGEINSLVHMMMNELIIVIDFVIAWQALAAAAAISFLTVLLSAWLPARKAAKITAIESIRGVGEIKLKAKEVRISPLVQKIFGFEGTLAAKNLKRNRRNFRASVASLTVGVILFINLSALSQQAGELEALMFPDTGMTVMVDYTSTHKGDTIQKPISSSKAHAVTEKLRQYPSTKIFGAGSDMHTYKAEIPTEKVTPEMQEAYFEDSEYLVRAEILILDEENYAALCKAAGVPIGSNIFLNRYDYNDNGKATVITPFLFDVESLRLIKGDGSVHEMEIHGVIAAEDVPIDLLGFNVGVARLVVPQGDSRFYSWFSAPEDIPGFMDYANKVMAEAFPRAEETGYMALGFTTRVYEMQDYIRVMNIAIVLGLVFVYGFVTLLALIGVTGVISAVSANVRMRSGEFAVLQSVGMTRDGLSRMLNLESMMYSAKALAVGLPVAIALTYVINSSIRGQFPIPYQFPWLAVILCVAVIFALTWGVIRYSAFKLRDGNIVETIRLEGR